MSFKPTKLSWRERNFQRKSFRKQSHPDIATPSTWRPFSGPEEEQEFLLRLSETIAWCHIGGRSDAPQTSLRRLANGRSAICSGRHAVFDTAEERRQLLTRNGFSYVHPAAQRESGALVVYYPERNAETGSAAAHSEALFDDDDAPPTDTWVWWVDDQRITSDEDGFLSITDASFVIAWIPTELIDLATDGVLHSSDHLLWFDDLQHPMKALIDQVLSANEQRELRAPIDDVKD